MNRVLVLFTSAFFLANSASVFAQTALSNPDAVAAMPVLKEMPTRFMGKPYGVIYEVSTGLKTTLQFSAEDGRLPEKLLPDNPGHFENILSEADPSFPRIEFNNGATYCSGTAIGDRYILTAGHCVFDRGQFRLNATVFPGWNNGKPSPDFGAFRAVRFLTFSGWTEGGDAAHDVAAIELDRALPPSIRRYQIATATPACDQRTKFNRHFYLEREPNQRELYNGGHHRGCKDDMMVLNYPTGPGSSGSAAILENSNVIYAVRSMTLKSIGYDARIGPIKRCFLMGPAGPC